MAGTVDLGELLKGMQPELEEGVSYVFLTAPHDLAKASGDCIGKLVTNHAIATFLEAEGLTVVVQSGFLGEHILSDSPSSDVVGEPLRAHWRAFAEKEELPPMSHITMRIHSSLSAVGFTAAFSRALTQAGISCNVFAAYFHDHIFVPAAAEKKAMEVLTALSKGTASALESA